MNPIPETPEVNEAMRLLRSLAGLEESGGSVKRRIEIAARRAGLTFQRARGLWYAEAKNVAAVEMDALRRASKSARSAPGKDNAANETDELRAEIAALRARLERLERRLDREAREEGEAGAGEAPDPFGPAPRGAR